MAFGQRNILHNWIILVIFKHLSRTTRGVGACGASRKGSVSLSLSLSRARSLSISFSLFLSLTHSLTHSLSHTHEPGLHAAWPAFPRERATLHVALYRSRARALSLALSLSRSHTQCSPSRSQTVAVRGWTLRSVQCRNATERRALQSVGLCSMQGCKRRARRTPGSERRYTCRSSSSPKLTGLYREPSMST
jgi:hypothetical protein